MGLPSWTSVGTTPSGLGELFSTRLAEHDMSVPMYRVLAVLRQEGPKTLTDLSRLTAVEMSTLSRLVGGMVRRGLLLRVRPEENGRIVRIELTGTGEDLVSTLMPIAIHYEQAATAGFRDADAEALKRLLLRIADNLDSLEE